MSHYKTIQALGTPIVVHSGVTAMLGSTTASILLSHIMYWSDKTDNPLGFYRTLDELKAETSLTENELRTARKLLVNLGLVDEKYARLEHRLYFKFNVQMFDKLFGEHLAKYEKSDLAKREKHNSPPVKFTNGEVQNPQIGNGENHSSLYTKNTTKNTTKITAECESPHAHENFETTDWQLSEDEILDISENFTQTQSLENTEPLAKTKKPKITMTATDLVNLGVENQIALDYLSIRKTKLTQTALNSIIKQAEQAGVSLNTAIEFCVTEGWQSFKADWYFNRINRQNSQGNYHAPQQPATPNTPSKPLDPSQAILCNGLLKPLFPNMNQQQSWNFLNSNREPFEVLDETHDRLMGEIDWQNFDYQAFNERFQKVVA